jgi:hypothetical protein
VAQELIYIIIFKFGAYFFKEEDLSIARGNELPKEVPLAASFTFKERSIHCQRQ